MPRSHAYIFILQSGLKQLSGIYITYLKCWWEILVILLLLLSIEIEIEGEVKFELLHIQELINRISIKRSFVLKVDMNLTKLRIIDRQQRNLVKDIKMTYTILSNETHSYYGNTPNNTSVRFLICTQIIVWLKIQFVFTERSLL